jgi:hypothetical protein
MKLESPFEALEQIRFQMNLLKLCSVPVELTGPSVMKDQEMHLEAVRVVEELEKTVQRLQNLRQ